MKKADIKIGTEYVSARSSSAYAEALSGSRYALVQRVRVLEVGAFRTYYGSGTWRGTITHDGVRVVVLEEQSGEPRLNRDGNAVEAVLRTAAIHREWEPFATERAERRKAVAKARRERVEGLERSVARMADALGVESLRDDSLPYAITYAGTIHGEGSFSTSVRLSVSDLVTLLERAHDAGRGIA